MFHNVSVHSPALTTFVALFFNVFWALGGVMQRLYLGLSNSSCSQNFAHLTICESELSITLLKGSFL